MEKKAKLLSNLQGGPKVSSSSLLASIQMLDSTRSGSKEEKIKQTKTNTGGCDKNPCPAGIACMANGNDDFHCLCSSGLFGKQCEVDCRPSKLAQSIENACHCDNVSVDRASCSKICSADMDECMTAINFHESCAQSNLLELKKMSFVSELRLSLSSCTAKNNKRIQMKFKVI